jgi:hypothetical protein
MMCNNNLLGSFFDYFKSRNEVDIDAILDGRGGGQ